jgi:hypothetical protein
MEQSVRSPVDGGPGVLTPTQVKSKYFEFFEAGSHHEVLLLGDLVEQYVHWVRSKGHKVLCTARVAPCGLCERALASDDVSTHQVEYYAPAFVRGWRERTFEQKVAVFSAGACEAVLKLLDGQPARGRRLDVERFKSGTTARFKVKPLDGLPSGFPSVLPPAFDLVPFVLARYGHPPDPRRPMVLLPEFKCEAVSAGPAGRPKPLALSPGDCKPPMTPQAAADLLPKARAWNSKNLVAECEAVLRAAGLNIPPAPLDLIASDPAPAAEELPTGRLAEPSAPYGPRVAVHSPATDAEVLADGTGRIVCREVKQQCPALNGTHAAQPKPAEGPADASDALGQVLARAAAASANGKNGHGKKGGVR